MKSRRTTITSAVVAAIIAVSVTGCAPGTSSQTSQGATSAASTAVTTPTGMPEGGPPAGAGGPGGTADTSAIRTKYLDVAYANKSAAQKMDVYMPNSGGGPFPVIVAIHGGAFLMGDKASGEITPMLTGLDRGYAVASINYRLSSEAKAPAQINDVKAAIRYLRANAAKYNIDPDRIAVWGGSAGGNLAAMAGTSGGVSSLSDASLGNATQSDSVQAVVDWFGPIDFAAMDAQFTASGSGPANHTAADSPESQLLGATLSAVPEKVKAANPMTFITADDPAFLIQHGTADANVPVEQSKNLAAALAKTLGAEKVTLKLLEGAGHADAAFTTADNVKLVLDWLDANLK